MISLTFSQWLALIVYATSLLGSLISAVVYLARMSATVTSLKEAIQSVVSQTQTHETRIAVLEEWKRLKD